MNFKNFDIFDLNYEYCSDEYGILDTPNDNLPKKGILPRILSLIKATLLIIINNKKKGDIIPNNSILFFGLNNNEKLAFSNVLNLYKSHHQIGDDRYVNGFPILKIYLTSLLFIPMVLFYYFKTKDTLKKLSFKYIFDFYCLSFAAILIIPNYLNKLKPSKIIISNHARPFQRIIMKLYAKKGLGFMQHASFINKMPPFKDFDYLLIDGQDSLNKLLNSNSSNNNIFLIGNVKYERFLNNTKSSNKLLSIGISINNLDKFSNVNSLIKKLKEAYPLTKLFLRPHPSEPRFNKFKEYSVLNGLIFSDSRKISSFNFLKSINVHIAGDSNIHMEAISMNIPSIYLNFENKKKDWYGFLKYGILYNGYSVNQIKKIINNIDFEKINVKKLLKPFNSSINTLYEGKSSSLAFNIIHENKSFIEKKFKKISYPKNNYIYKLKE
tara:strand:+ start:1420 stop:2733 length:1314 start_codon:yes stop_codon:yes gene_type:complete